MTLYTHKNRNIAKTWMLMTLFFVVIILLGWLFASVYQTPEILYGAFIISFSMNVVSFVWSDKVVTALTGAREARRDDYFDLYTTVENLTITAGLPKPRVYIIEDSAPNAFATGRNPEHAVIAVTTGLLSALTKTELEGVIAHELSHIGNRDILVSTVAVVLVGFVALLSDFFLRMSFWGGNRDREGRGGAILFFIAIIAALFAPLAATLMQLAISRKREFLADASGALLTRYPEGLASALTKISAYSAPMKRASDATAHLFIANPFGPGARTKFLTRLFMTHPPLAERIAALRSQ